MNVNLLIILVCFALAIFVGQSEAKAFRSGSSKIELGRIRSCGNYTEGTHLALYANGTQITRYYLICYAGVFLVEECPEKMGYNERAGYCAIGGGGGNGNQGQPCGPNFPDGSIASVPGSVTKYQLCQNKNIITMECALGQIFNSGSNYCENPCAFVPSGDMSVLVSTTANGYFKCTPGGQLVSYTTQLCTSGQYYQALANTGNPCYTVPTCPAGPSYVNIGIPETALTSPPAPVPKFDLTSATRYYVSCNGQTAPMIQRCSPGSVILFGFEDQGCIKIEMRRRSSNFDVAEFDEKNVL